MSAVPNSEERRLALLQRSQQNVATLQRPGPRQIPLPEHIPVERTSTASYKAPVTAAALAKKRAEAPPPPPAGTLSTAIGYISSPVKYLSSMFSSPAPVPEPTKPKPKQFKIDIEREMNKERNKERQQHQQQISPKRSPTVKMIQHTVEDNINSAPPPLQPPPSNRLVEKEPVPTWMRKNNMGIENHAPQPQSSRWPSPKRTTPMSAGNVEQSPTQFSQLKIASSSSAQNSYKVMSKNPPEEPVKKVKKDPRKITSNGRQVKEAPQLATNTKPRNRFNKSFPKDDMPYVPFPTVLPPRIPPPTYTIKSAPVEDTENFKESGENFEKESTENLEEPVIRHIPSPRFKNLQEDTAIDPQDEEDLILEEMSFYTNPGDNIKVTRLDKLSNGLSSGQGGSSKVRELLHATTLMKSNIENYAENGTVTANRVDPANIVLCASTNYIVNAPYKPTNPNQVVDKTSSLNRKTKVDRQLKPSNPMKSPSPTFLDRENGKAAKQGNGHKTIYSAPKTHPSKTLKKNQSPSLNRTKSPRHSDKETLKKTSTWKVDDKHRAAVKDALALSSPDKRRTQSMKNIKTVLQSKNQPTEVVNSDPKINFLKKMKSREKSPDQKTSPATALNAVATTATAAKINFIKNMKSREKSPDQKPTRTPSPPAINTVATAAVATAAAAAVVANKLLRGSTPNPQEVKPDTAISEKIKEQPDPVVEKPVPKSPPASWKMDSNGKLIPGTPSPKSFKPENNEINTSEPETKNVEKTISGQIAARRSKSKLRNIVTKDFKKKDELTVTPSNKKGINEKSVLTEVSNKIKICSEDPEEFNCVDNYCGDPTKFCKAATMMGEIP